MNDGLILEILEMVKTNMVVIMDQKTVAEKLQALFEQQKSVKNNVVLSDVRLSSDVCDAKITKYADTLDIPEGQDQYTHDTAFINGAIWMREEIGKLQTQDEA